MAFTAGGVASQPMDLILPPLQVELVASLLISHAARTRKSWRAGQEQLRVRPLMR
jgi:hypothetical protein